MRTPFLSALLAASLLLPGAQAIASETSSEAVFLVGEFNNPGPKRIPSGVNPTLMAMILRSGGLTPAADLSRVTLVHYDEDQGRGSVEQINLQRLLTSDDKPRDYQRTPGDFVFVAGYNALADKGDAKAELQELVGKIRLKLKDGKPTEKDLADELKQFDALLAAHKGEKTDDVAQILVMKAMLYIQVFDNEEKGMPMLKQVKTDFPDTRPGKQVDAILASIEKQAESKKIQRALAVGAKFPDFDEKDTTGHPLSIARFKGKVVLVDFWATWCGPCIGELPNVLKAYEKHHPNGFEIIGISLDENEGKLSSFTKERGMTWPQYFDGLKWGNKLAAKYGVNSIPATYLLDGEGKIIAKNLRGEALEKAVTEALAKK